MPLFYSDKKDKAVALMREQIADGWQDGDIRQYWYLLGYDCFFIDPALRAAHIG